MLDRVQTKFTGMRILGEIYHHQCNLGQFVFLIGQTSHIYHLGPGISRIGCHEAFFDLKTHCWPSFLSNNHVLAQCLLFLFSLIISFPSFLAFAGFESPKVGPFPHASPDVRRCYLFYLQKVIGIGFVVVPVFWPFPLAPPPL